METGREFNSPNKDKSAPTAHTVKFSFTDCVLRSTEVGVMKIPDRQSDRNTERDTDTQTDRQRQSESVQLTQQEQECPAGHTVEFTSTNCVLLSNGVAVMNIPDRQSGRHRQAECSTHPTRTRVPQQPTLSGSTPPTVCWATRR